jgi:membrane-bound ClpP family serine protease
LKSFIVFNIIEESILAIIAFIILMSLAPSYLVPGMAIVAIGLVIFTLVKIYFYRSSVAIPVYDPLIQQPGVSLTDFLKDEGGVWRGRVQVRGEVWKAQALESIPKNSTIWVQSVEGLTLFVTMTEKK